VSDDFSADFDYSGGGTNGIWDANYNSAAGAGVFDANISNGGTLTIEVNNVNIGWEGGRSTAPYLATNVPAGQDFTATVKVAAQVNGNWSAAGLIARAQSATDPGTGANNADENYITTTTFRTDPGNADFSTTQMKRIQGGAQAQDSVIPINDPGNEPVPIWVRLERIYGTGYRTWVSTDGTNFQFQSNAIPAAGNPLRDLTLPMEVGLSFMTFGTATSGQAELDDFELDWYDPVAAPGAPTLSGVTDIFVVPGWEIQHLITGDQTGLTWARTPNLSGTDAVIPAQGGQNALLFDPLPGDGSATYFRWTTSNCTTGCDNGDTATVNITGTNAAGQASTAFVLNIHFVPEPASAGLVLLGCFGLIGLVGRRRR
jgi:hypothetical protein